MQPASILCGAELRKHLVSVVRLRGNGVRLRHNCQLGRSRTDPHGPWNRTRNGLMNGVVGTIHNQSVFQSAFECITKCTCIHSSRRNAHRSLPATSTLSLSLQPCKQLHRLHATQTGRCQIHATTHCHWCVAHAHLPRSCLLHNSPAHVSALLPGTQVCPTPSRRRARPAGSSTSPRWSQHLQHRQAPIHARTRRTRRSSRYSRPRTRRATRSGRSPATCT